MRRGRRWSRSGTARTAARPALEAVLGRHARTSVSWTASSASWRSRASGSSSRCSRNAVISASSTGPSACPAPWSGAWSVVVALPCVVCVIVGPLRLRAGDDARPGRRQNARALRPGARACSGGRFDRAGHGGAAVGTGVPSGRSGSSSTRWGTSTTRASSSVSVRTSTPKKLGLLLLPGPPTRGASSPAGRHRIDRGGRTARPAPAPRRAPCVRAGVRFVHPGEASGGGATRRCTTDEAGTGRPGGVRGARPRQWTGDRDARGRAAT